MAPVEDGAVEAVEKSYRAAPDTECPMPSPLTEGCGPRAGDPKSLALTQRLSLPSSATAESDATVARADVMPKRPGAVAPPLARVESPGPAWVHSPGPRGSLGAGSGRLPNEGGPRPRGGRQTRRRLGRPTSLPTRGWAPPGLASHYARHRRGRIVRPHLP